MYRKIAVFILLCLILYTEQVIAMTDRGYEKQACFDCCAPGKGESLCSVGYTICTIGCFLNCPTGQPYECGKVIYPVVGCLSISPERYDEPCYTVIMCETTGAMSQYIGVTPCGQPNCDPSDKQWLERCREHNGL